MHIKITLAVLVAVALSLLAVAGAQAASFDAAVSWTDNSTNEEGFRIYRNNVMVGTTATNVSSFTDVGLAENTVYCYRVGAVNAAGETQGPETCAATGTVLLPPAAPGSPTIIYIGKP